VAGTQGQVSHQEVQADHGKEAVHHHPRSLPGMSVPVCRILGLLPISEVRGKAQYRLPPGYVPRSVPKPGLHKQPLQSGLGLEPPRNRRWRTPSWGHRRGGSPLLTRGNLMLAKAGPPPSKNESNTILVYFSQRNLWRKMKASNDERIGIWNIVVLFFWYGREI